MPTDLAIGIAVPLIVGGAWLGLRWMKRRIHDDGGRISARSSSRCGLDLSAELVPEGAIGNARGMARRESGEGHPL